MKNPTSMLFLLSFLFAGTVVAGEYTQKGYITEVKANIQGSTCDIMISSSVGGGNLQGGTWDCNSFMGQNLLDVARMASVLGLKVAVTLEGNGADYKPVYAINIINH
ncbi:hypothetical protein KAT72_09955 [Aeromonas popoffii]|uniref:Uncharacterized protein n=1 Tax=Aeromonas popoffii TaxID=70856 RepID=A0ABS5GR81_9GAMM|nr:hypothetical protein [Aeromonas popoffii]MBR7629337.1 hypothetical protein [Aeromonas popoffii]